MGAGRNDMAIQWSYAVTSKLSMQFQTTVLNGNSRVLFAVKVANVPSIDIRHPFVFETIPTYSLDATSVVMISAAIMHIFRMASNP